MIEFFSYLIVVITVLLILLVGILINIAVAFGYVWIVNFIFGVNIPYNVESWFVVTFIIALFSAYSRRFKN